MMAINVMNFSHFHFLSKRLEKGERGGDRKKGKRLGNEETQGFKSILLNCCGFCSKCKSQKSSNSTFF